MDDGNHLKLLLFSGDYAAVLSFAAAAAKGSVQPAVIAALALSGRLDEAESAHRALLEEGDLDECTEARFFLIAGLCHAGDSSKALVHARSSLTQLRAVEARSRFWIWQGLALVRFFQGRMRPAKGFARRALKSAVATAFPYARVLTLDLLAHVLVYGGDVFAGVRMLGQAADLALALGYEENAATLRVAARVFEASHLLTDISAAIAQAEAELAGPAVSYFTRRNGLIELATTLVLRGAGRQAATMLGEARRIALPGSDRRAKARWWAAHALHSLLSKSTSEARTSLAQARAYAADERMVLAEIGFLELAFFPDVSAEAAAALHDLGRQSGMARLNVAAAAWSGQSLPLLEQVEDGLARLVLGCRGQPPLTRLRQVLDAELFGLVGFALAFEPDRRVIVTPREIITQDAGDVAVRALPGGPSVRMLLALRSGYQSREALIGTVWGLGSYNPNKHNAVINTAVSRLRLALGQPGWIITHEMGYSLDEGVGIVTLKDAQPLSTTATSHPPPPSLDGRVMRFIAEEGAASSAEVARALRISASSALRRLRQLAAAGQLERVGRGRATRYQLCASPDVPLADTVE